MNKQKRDDIIYILKKELSNDLEKYLTFYSESFAIKNDNIFFTITIDKNEAKIFNKINAHLKVKLDQVHWIKKIEFITTSHNRIDNASQNSKEQNSDVIARYIVPVASGKGGVGKSTTAINLALALKSLGKNVGILDADIYGPSLPRLTGINSKPIMHNKKILPQNAFGLQSMSIGYLIPEDSATIWRGPMVMTAINQLIFDVFWQDLDFLIIDMPPGTGDAQLTLSQKVQLAGAVIVSTPQDLSLIDARKGINMFKKVNVPILGIIENMSYFLCTKCKERHYIFGNKGAKREAEKLGLPFLGEVPIDINLRINSDEGTPLFLKDPKSSTSKVYSEISKNLLKTLEKNQIKSPKILLN